MPHLPHLLLRSTCCQALLESKLLWANVNEKQQEVVQAEGFLKKAKDLLHAYKEQADNESGPLR